MTPDTPNARSKVFARLLQELRLEPQKRDFLCKLYEAGDAGIVIDDLVDWQREKEGLPTETDGESRLALRKAIMVEVSKVRTSVSQYFGTDPAKPYSNENGRREMLYFQVPDSNKNGRRYSLIWRTRELPQDKTITPDKSAMINLIVPVIQPPPENGNRCAPLIRFLTTPERIASFVSTLNAELRSVDLSERAPHERLVELFARDKPIVARLGRKNINLAASLLSETLRSGFLPKTHRSALSARPMTFAVAPVSIAPTACFFLIREEFPNIALRHDGVLAVDFIRDTGQPQPEVIVGADGLALEALRSKGAIYNPLAAATPLEICLIESPDAQTPGQPSRAYQIIGPLEAEKTSSFPLFDERYLIPRFDPKKFPRVHGDVSKAISSVQKDPNSDRLILTAKAVADFAQGEKLAKLVPVEQRFQLSSLNPWHASGALVVREDIDRDSTLREAITVAFLRAYNKLVRDPATRKRVAIRMLKDSDFSYCYASAIGVFQLNKLGILDIDFSEAETG